MNTTTDQRRGVVQQLYAVKRWMYRTGRPGALARVMNRISAVQFSSGLLSPARAVTLEIPGRRTGRLVSFPVVIADYEGERYLVSMLGMDANWVLNVRAAGGRVALRRGRREEVRLEEVEPGYRAPILRRYLAARAGSPASPAGGPARPAGGVRADRRSVPRLPDHSRRPERDGWRSPHHATRRPGARWSSVPT